MFRNAGVFDLSEWLSFQTPDYPFFEVLTLKTGFLTLQMAGSSVLGGGTCGYAWSRSISPVSLGLDLNGDDRNQLKRSWLNGEMSGKLSYFINGASCN